MATGSFNLTKSANNSSGSYIIGKIDWSSTKNIDGNYSSITATLYCKKLNDSMVLTQTTGGTWTYSLNINGSTISGSVKKDILSDWVAMATHAVQVSHNADGAKTITISGSVTAPSGSSYAGLTSSGSKSVALDTIPRASSVTATNANIGSNTTITINRASSSFTHTLQYSFAGLTGTIGAPKTASTSVTWTVPTTFYAKIPNARNGTCTITCTTYNGDTQVGTSTTCTFTATASESLCKPTLSPTYVDTNSATVALTGNNKKFVRYFSTAQLATGAAARNSATLTSQKITCGSKFENAGTATFSNIESGTFVFSATDSREYPTTQTVEATMVPYVKLTCVLSKASASAADGAVTLTVSGSFYNGSFGSKSNTLNVYYRYKATGGSYGSDVKIANVTMSGNTYTSTFTVSGLDYTKAYVFQAYAKDSLMSLYSTEQPVRITPIFDWGENDFRFNVPVKLPSTTMIDGVEDPSVAATRGYVNNHISAHNQHGLVKFRAYEFTGGNSNWASFTDNWDSVAVGTFSALLKASGGSYGCCFGYKVSADYGAAIYFSYSGGTVTMYRYLTGTWYQHNLN